MSQADAGVGMSDDVQYVLEELARMESTIEELQTTVAEKDRRIDRLEDRVDELDERTDMLRMVEQADQMTAQQRRAALLQHLYREAKRNGGSTAINRDRAEEVLHFPDIHRTTYYTDFEEIERLVDDDAVCQYDSDGQNGRLVLDLTEGDLPDRVHSKLNGGV